MHSISEMQAGDPTVYTHDAVLQQNGQSVTGSGGYPVGGPYSYPWHVVSGSVVGNTLTLDIQYDAGVPASVVHHMTGTIAANGSISGTWNDDAFGTPRTGTFTMPAGSATPAVTFCGKGTASYTDEQNNWYLMNVKAVSVEGNTAWIAAQILASSSNLGYENTPTNYLFLKVTDIAEPGIGHDYMGGDLMTETDAVAAVLAHNDPSATATINAGNIQVH